MFKKTLLTIAAFALVGACVMGVGIVVSGSGLPQAISENSPCPVTGCANGQCHGYGDVPEPDGIHEMTCPESACSSVECHAWDTLQGRYHQASDASLNLWLMIPAGILVVVIILATLLKVKTKPEDLTHENEDGDKL